MKGKRKNVILLMGMTMILGLTACQKKEEETEMDSKPVEAVSEERVNAAQPSEDGQETDTYLNSFSSSPEVQACGEWRDFRAGYDPDSTILMGVLDQEEDETSQPDEYEDYACYTDEMKNKVDEICTKYGLAKLSGLQYDVSYDEICSQAGTGKFCQDSEAAKHDLLSGFLYDDGSFLIEGNLMLSGSTDTKTIYDIGYLFSRSVKGTFNASYLNLGDLSQYNVRKYITKGGDEVFFLCHEEINPNIIAEREKSFIVISGLGDLLDVSDVNDERLELFAEAFDFSVIP